MEFLFSDNINAFAMTNWVHLFYWTITRIPVLRIGASLNTKYHRTRKVQWYAVPFIGDISQPQGISTGLNKDSVIIPLVPDKK